MRILPKLYLISPQSSQGWARELDFRSTQKHLLSPKWCTSDNLRAILPAGDTIVYIIIHMSNWSSKHKVYLDPPKVWTRPIGQCPCPSPDLSDDVPVLHPTYRTVSPSFTWPIGQCPCPSPNLSDSVLVLHPTHRTVSLSLSHADIFIIPLHFYMPFLLFTHHLTDFLQHNHIIIVEYNGIGNSSRACIN